MNFELLKRLSQLLATSFLFLFTSFAQEVEKKDFEITSHKVRIQLFPSSQEIICSDTVTVRILNRKAESIEFGLAPFFKLKEVWLNGEDADYERTKGEVKVEDIPDTVFDVVFDYEARMNFRTEYSNLGSERAVLRDEEILPRGNRNVKNARFTIEVPSDWQAVAPGKLMSQDSVGGVNVFVWELNQPVPMLGWICAGKFKQEKKEGSVAPISTFLFEEDSAHAARILSLTDSVLKYYNRIFSPYRFPKLSIVEVENWVAGKAVLAIATPSMILVKKLAFETEDEFNKYPMILPHEVAHQWWPITVFIEDKDAAFLSEGMCEYSARLFSESCGKMTVRDSLVNHPLLRSLITRSLKGLDIPLQQRADLRAMPTHYLKASFVHNMLRNLLGDSLFVEMLHQYAKRFSEKTVTMEEFQNLVEELSGKKFDWFFEQWVKGKGIPRMKIYNAKATQKENKWQTKGRVRIVGYDKFTTFVDVGIETPSETVKTRVWLGADSGGNYKNDVGFETLTNEKPTFARLDPNGDVLKFRKLPVRLGDLREPSDGVMIVGTLSNTEYLMQRAQHDSTEMDIAGWSFTIKADTAISLADLQNDRVFLYGKPNENSVVAEQMQKFPHQFNGDSIVINHEATFDSSLTFIQAIENPYIVNGIMCWIAPLSHKAEPELMPYDHSWILVRGKEEIVSGTWEVKDEEVVVEVK